VNARNGRPGDHAPRARQAGSVLELHDHFIDGVWTRGNGQPFESVDPYTEKVWAMHTAASEADVDAAVTAATGAFDAWRRTSGYERGRLLFRLADLMERNSERLAELETHDNGKLLTENRVQIASAVRMYRYFAGMADKLNGESKPLDTYATVDYTTREPVGVCALLSSWNSPQQILANKLPPALAAGNTVVIKPSEFTSVSTLELAGLVAEAGLPAGVVNVITGAGDIGRTLTSHPGLGKISLTGGVETARQIAANAAKNVVPATFELGGKSAHIVFPDANLDRAIPAITGGIFAAAGQTCVAGSRLLLHDDIYDEVVSAVIKRAEMIRCGDPMDAQTEMGPLIHRRHFERVRAIIASAHEDGAKLLTGGQQPVGFEGTLFMAPTVFGEVRNDSRLARQEVFGPVLAVLRFSTDEEAISIANDSEYGLAGGVWTNDITRAHSVAKAVRAGTIWVNTYRMNPVQAPSGGFKNSGYGRERGVEVLAEYTTTKNIMIDLTC
jgi:aldehyde dehydrogenase (NAD+)